MQPSAISALSCRSDASLNSLAMRDAIVEPGSKSDADKAVGVSDDEGHRHRLAERATEAEHDGADDADAGLRQQDVAHDLPGGAADAVGALAQDRRDLVEDVARDRGDERNDHDGENDAGGQNADA